MKWAASAQEAFRFSFKANRKITHFMKLKNAGKEFEFFLKGLNPLEKKMGCVLVQLPPFMKRDYETLETFLKEKPEPIPVAVEFRHTSWFSAELLKLLSKYDTALCVAETEDMKPVFERTASFIYVRLRHDRYSKTELKERSQKLVKFTNDAEDCYVYFKHDDTGDAANKAVDFSTMLNS